MSAWRMEFKMNSFAVPLKRHIISNNILQKLFNLVCSEKHCITTELCFMYDIAVLPTFMLQGKLRGCL